MQIEHPYQSVDPSIFRAYDIRGIVDQSLTAEQIYLIGCALGTKARALGEPAMIVGRDGRLSSPALGNALCEGILASGCDVIDIGLVPTPLLYYATAVLDTHTGTMLTGSHNPAEYNGLKMVLGGKPLAENAIQNLYQMVTEKKFTTGDAQLSTLDVIERYMVHVCRDIKIKRPLKVVIDCGNGAAAVVAPELYRRLGIEVIELFCEVDGHFPNHHPDPSDPKNLNDLIHAVKLHKADIGLAFDGDGDRLGVVTSRGEIIWPDRQLILFAKSILARRPGAKIIYDVKCTSHLEKMIRSFGGEPIMWKTGHSFIKAKLASSQAVLAGEMSGHLFFRDRWYGFDDAIYAGARLLQILAESPSDSHDLFQAIPNSVNTPELKINVAEHEKFSLMEKLIRAADFSLSEKITIDGLRVNFNEGWGLVRASNTTPCLVLRFEAENDTVMKKIQNAFRELLMQVKPDLVLPF